MICEESRSLLHSYVDGELPAGESLALESHLLDCRACAGEYQELRTVVDTIRGAKPLYHPPAGGRLKIESLMKAHYRRRLILRLVFSTAACVLIAGATFLFYRTRQDAPFEHFVDSAADAHLRYVRGTLDLDFRSEEGPVVSAWLGERLPFQTALPKHPAQPVVRSRYTLVGARVLPFEDHNLGYVAYQMQGKPISLLISSAAVVRPSGGQVYRSGALLFHFFSRDGLQLIAWMDRGLSYALVSDVQVSGAESCVVCHGSDTERQKFENLAPLPEGAITPKP